MRSGKKIAIAIFMSLMVVVLAACGSGGASSPGASSTTGKATKASDDKQIFRFPVVGDIQTVDPALVEDTDSSFVIENVYTGLVTLDDSLKVKTQLASSYDVSSDGLTYTFKLKPNLKFSDGKPMTSQDVVYSINRTLLPATNSPVSSYLSLVTDSDKMLAGKVPTLIGSSLLAPDPNTVVIKINKPAAYFLQALAYPTSFVVEKSLIDKYGAKFTDHLNEGGSSGPFKVASYSHTTGFELVPNDNYYGPKPALKHLSIPFYTDQDGMYKAYQANQLDFAYVPPDHVATDKSAPGYKDTPRLTIRYVMMNYLTKPFDNIKIRQAFALALNKDLMVQSALRGVFSATNHIVPSGMPGYDATLTGPDGVAATAGDPAKAKQLLQDGLKEEGLSALPPITLTYYPRNQGFKDAIVAAQQMWTTNLGVNVKIVIVSRAQELTLTTATKGNASLQMWVAGWNADYPDPQDWLSTFFAKNVDYNQSNYGQNSSSVASAQQAVQQQLSQADVTQDATQRMKLYNDAEQKIINDAGWIPLWQERVQSLTRPTVQGLVLNAQLTIPPDDWANIYISQ